MTAKRSKKIFAAAIAASQCAVAGAYADGLQAGHWKIVSKTVLNGGTSPGSTKMLCLSPPEAADVDTLFSPKMATINSDCKRIEHELTPTSLKWRLQCTGQMNMEVAAAFTFDTPQHYTAQVITKGAIAGQSMATEVTIDAERVGDCPPAQ